MRFEWALVKRLALTILLLALPGQALANPAAKAKAREHFERGETQYRLGNFARALKEYQTALKHVRRPSIIFNIAQSYRQLGEYRRAVFYYKLYLSDWERVHPDRTAPYRTEVKEHIRRLAAAARRKEAEKKDGPGFDEPPGPGAASVQLDGAPDGARVFVDGVLIARTPLEVPLSMSPGQHRIEVVARGSEPFTQNLSLASGEHKRVLVDVGPALPRKRDKTYLAIGVPALALGLGMEVMAIVASVKGNELVIGVDDAQLSTYKTLNIVGHVGFGVFTAGAITSFVLFYFSDTSGSGRTARLNLAPLPGGGMVGGTFRF